MADLRELSDDAIRKIVYNNLDAIMHAVAEAAYRCAMSKENSNG